jgi:glycerol-3-phosphate dehydrogenase
VSWIGTTDDDYYGEMDNLTATQDEVEYLLEGMERVLPRIRDYRRTRVTVGLRPTLHAWGKYEDDISRRYEVVDHEKRDGVSGFVTLAGGKLAAYRLMAQDTTDVVARKLGVTAECRTHLELLPGAEAPADTPEMARKAKISLFAAERTASRHGVRADRVLSLIEENPRWSREICACEQVTEAEVRYCLREECAISVSDLWFRTRLGMGTCHGMTCAMSGARILADERGLSPEEAHTEVARFLESRWRDKLPVADGLELAQEELARSIFLGTFAYDDYRDSDPD